MGDWGLEDKLLRRNIPGRYTHWDRDSDEELAQDKESEVSEEEEEQVEVPQPTEVPEAMRYGEAPGAHRAGAKGQLAQYRYFKRMEYQEKMLDKAQRQAALFRAAAGAVRDDDDFLASYRERRLNELKEEASKPVFGSLRRDATKDDYLAAIAVPRVVVVVHLHEPRHPACRRLEDILAVLATRRKDISFLSMTLDEAGQTFDRDVLPVLALYKDGDIVDSLFCVTNDLDVLSEHDDLERLIDTSAAFAKQGDDVPGVVAQVF